MNPTLKPCAHCGGEASDAGVVRYNEAAARNVGDGKQREYYFCSCIRCGVSNKGLTGHVSKETAIAAWNRRADDWQDISTAPRDGTSVLLHGNCIRPSVDAGKPATVIGYWTDHNAGGWVWYGAAMEFTHWMPIAAGPGATA